MTYAGNPSLAQETKTRILDTYSQTLDLAEQGRTQEAALGCDFILKMDPLFSPARELQGRLEGAAGGIDVSDLRPAAAGDNGDAAAEPASAAPPIPEAPAAEPPPPPAFEPALVDEAEEAIPMVEEVEAEPIPEVEAIPDVEAVPEVEAIPEVEAAPLPSELEGAVVDAPAEAAATPAAPGPPGEGSSRVDELLAEGQQHFEANDLQAAIDAWSRIFLIDIENQEAARRIEQARKLRDEHERQVEELFHEAVGHRDAGRVDEAREALQRVLQLQPNHLAAQESLEQLESGAAAPVEGAGEAPAEIPDLPPPPPPAEEPESPGDEGLFDPAHFEGAEEGAGASTVVSAGKSTSGPSRRFVTIGVVVALVAAAAGYYVWDHRDELFPNAQEPAATAEQQPKRLDEVDRAVRLRADGRVEEAIAMLEELPADHPRHDIAQQHLANWREEVGPRTEEPEAEGTGDEPVDLARREKLLEQARAAYGRKEFLTAARAFSAADSIAPLEGPADDLFRDAKRQLLPIANQIDLFRQREWELLLPSLWRLLEREPGNRDVRQLLADSYYNLGVMDLRRSAPDRAVERFREVTKLEPDNQMSARLLGLSDAYSSRPIDPLYRIFVQQLDIRR